MTEHITAKLPKWPFLFGDITLLALAGFVILQNNWPLNLWLVGASFAGVAFGAWLAILPFLKEYQAATRVTEANVLSGAMAQLKNVEEVNAQIAGATAKWTDIHQHCTRTVESASHLSDRMKAEVQEFCSFLDKANEVEKNHLKLELEKLRRVEGEWLQVVVRMLDHVYALQQAGARSGQPMLMAQLNQFQNACRDASRRVGLIPYVPAKDEVFDNNLHQLQDSEPPLATSKSYVGDILATGFSYQGQLIRKALIRLKPDAQPELPLTTSTETRPGSL